MRSMYCKLLITTIICIFLLTGCGGGSGGGGGFSGGGIGTNESITPPTSTTPPIPNPTSTITPPNPNPTSTIIPTPPTPDPTSTVSPSPSPTPTKNWYVTWSPDRKIIQISYGYETDNPQYAAIYPNDGILRMNYGPHSDWGSYIFFIPSYWENTIIATWDNISPPGYVKQLISYNNDIYALTKDTLYKSSNNGNSWQTITIGLPTGDLNFIDIDQNKIYIACRNGIIVSENLNGNFAWSLFWTWDSCDELDMQDGYGLCSIANWGSKSGLNRKTPNGDWELILANKTNLSNNLTERPGGSGTDMAVDPIDPYNIMFYCSTMTNDSGVTWQNVLDEVMFYTIWDGLPTAFGHNKYTNDRGTTWKTHGLNDAIAMVKGPDNLLYATSVYYNGNNYAGVFRGVPNQWTSLGLENSYIVTDIAVNNNYVFAGIMVGSPSNPEPNNLRRGLISSGMTYHQGAPVTVNFEKQGQDLLIKFSGTIYGLNFEGTILLNPPLQDSLTATVNVTTSGNINLANNPNQSFKPTVESSMHISETQYDCHSSFVGTTTYPIPNDQWLIPNPITDTVFGLNGGTSAWKPNAPTMTITLNTPMPITGWVTASNDPNDDNVSIWPASDTVLRSWSYTIKASKPE